MPSSVNRAYSSPKNSCRNVNRSSGKGSRGNDGSAWQSSRFALRKRRRAFDSEVNMASVTRTAMTCVGICAAARPSANPTAVPMVPEAT